MPDSYNPLDRINLARSVEVTLLQQRPLPLPLEDAFNGAGIYAIYYTGDFAAYRPVSSAKCKVPIYVGKADPPGSRKGLVDLSGSVGSPLFNRISQHAASVEAAKNLDVEDFRARYLVVEDIFIGMGEALLIQQFRPLWNQHVSGFGLHDPGSGRHGSKRSEWDELHPGRPWHGKMKQVTTAADIRRKIKAAFDTGAAATTDRPASSAAPSTATVATEVPD